MLNTFPKAFAVLCFVVGHTAFAINIAQAAPITIAISEVGGFYPAGVAAQQGYFEKEGLEVKVLTCINGKRCLKHLTDGEADISTTADMPLVLAAHEGRQFGVVATMCSSVKDNVFLVRADSGIKSPADLKGKKVGSVPGTSSQYFADTFLNFYGIDTKSVTRVNIDPATVISQAEAGAFEAAGLYEPLATTTMKSLRENWLQLPNPRLYTTTFNLVASPTVSDENIVKVLKAIKKAIQASKSNSNLTSKMPKVENYDCNLRLSQTLLNTMEAQSRWAMRQNLVDAKTAPDFLNYIRTAPLQSVDKRSVSLMK